MKKLTIEQIRSLDFQSKVNGKSVPHQEVFIDDEDMVKTLSVISQHELFRVVRGKTWFTLAHTSLERGWTLSDKQITQLRRQSQSVIEFLTHIANSHSDIINKQKLEEFYNNF